MTGYVASAVGKPGKKRPCMISVGMALHAGGNKKSSFKLAASVNMPDGLALEDLPFVSKMPAANELPTLTRTMLSFATFDGSLFMSQPGKPHYRQTVQAGLWVESGCTMPSTGALGKLLNDGKYRPLASWLMLLAATVDVRMHRAPLCCAGALQLLLP